MISKTVILFLFGATVASGQFYPRLLRPTPYDLSLMPELRSSGCPSGPELAPVICQFMQPNIGLNYKPSLIPPSTYISPLVVEKCDQPKLEIHLPPKKPIVIPEAPILPPITVPKFPLPMIVEKPMVPPVAIAEPCEPAIISDMSAVSIPVAPSLPSLEMPALPVIAEQHAAYLSEDVINEIDYKPMVVPSPPQLPPLVMPALPAIAEQHGAYLTEAAINEISYNPMVFPQPPQLPAVVMPEPPVRVEQPMFVAPCAEDVPIPVAPIAEYFKPLAPIPAVSMLPPVAPEVPVRVEIPTPVQPMIIERPIEEPCFNGEIVVHAPAPVVVPQPPRIPVYPEPTFLAEPCEPALEPVMKVAQLPPYFVRNSPGYIPVPTMGRGLLAARSIVVQENAVPRTIGRRFRPVHNAELRPLAHGRRFQ